MGRVVYSGVLLLSSNGSTHAIQNCLTLSATATGYYVVENLENQIDKNDQNAISAYIQDLYTGYHCL